MIPIPACRVATAPGDGRVVSLLDRDRPVRAGDVVGVVETAGGVRDVLAPGAGTIGGPLVRRSQQVHAGEAVVWLARA